MPKMHTKEQQNEVTKTLRENLRKLTLQSNKNSLKNFKGKVCSEADSKLLKYHPVWVFIFFKSYALGTTSSHAITNPKPRRVAGAGFYQYTACLSLSLILTTTTYPTLRTTRDLTSPFPQKEPARFEPLSLFSFLPAPMPFLQPAPGSRLTSRWTVTVDRGGLTQNFEPV